MKDTRYTWRSQLFTVSILLVLLTQKVTSQTGIGGVGSGVGTKISVPWRDKDGNLTWVLNGERAINRSDGKIEVDDVTVNKFTNSQVDWTITTPHCVILNEKSDDRKIVSDSEVHISNKDTDIKGVGFYCLVDLNQFIIRNQVEVTIYGRIIKDNTSMNLKKNISLFAFATGAALFPNAYAETPTTNLTPPPAPVVAPSTPVVKPSSTTVSSPPKPFTKINSDNLNFDYEKKVAVFDGNVFAVDPQLTLRCKTMKVFFADKSNDVIRVEAYGDVHMLQDSKEGMGEKAVFTKDTGMIVISGGVPTLLDEKGNRVISRGTGIYYNVNTKKMEADKATVEFKTSESNSSK